MTGRTRRAIVLGAAIAVMTAVPAFAYWTSAGSASGAAAIGTTTPFTATGTTTGLYPGGSAAVQLTVDRTGLPALTLASVTGPSGSITVSGAPGCTNSAITISFAAAPSQVVVFPAGQQTTIGLPAASHMGTAAQNACQGGTFAVPVTVTAVQ